MVIIKKSKVWGILATSLFLLSILLPFPVAIAQESGGASLYIVPTRGAYAIGDIVTASIYVNTGGRAINAIQADLNFPADKLQVVSPSAGKSVIDVWVGQPAYSNTAGTLSFKGTIPNPGLNVNEGLISTVSFRVKSTGKAVISFSDTSRVLLNDGRGTNVLSSQSGSILDLLLPAPQGPIVVSPTHPDQSRWYTADVVSLEWHGDSSDQSYSYILDDDLVSAPDDIAEGSMKSVTYKSVPDGMHYFHIKSHNGGVWGGSTHYAIRIDKTPPSDFQINVEPRTTTTEKRPVITFYTTDSLSGVEHYELKMVSLTAPPVGSDIKPQEFFIEAKSPYVPELYPGKYDVIVRAYDQAGNVREVKERLNILTPALQALEWIIPSSVLGFGILFVVFLISAYLYYRYKTKHAEARIGHEMGAMLDKDVATKLEKLREYQKKYGTLVLLLFLLINIFIFSGSNTAMAMAGENGVEPPIVTTLPNNITNQELFYVGGKHADPGALITIYLQNSDTGETLSFQTVTDKKGDWFYDRSDFLPVGKYLLWAQAKVGDQSSSPTGRENVVVEATALRLGSSHISYELLYLLVSSMFLIATVILFARALHHYRMAKHRKKLLLKEIEEAEQSIHRGFAIVRRDIETALSNMEHRKNNTVANREEIERERALLVDLRTIEDTIGKEVWDIRTNVQ